MYSQQKKCILSIYSQPSLYRHLINWQNLLEQHFEWKESLAQGETDYWRNLNNIVFNIPRNICRGYLLESPCWGYSNKYLQHRFLRVNKERKGFLLIIKLLYFEILYSGKFFLIAESLGTIIVFIKVILYTFFL